MNTAAAHRSYFTLILVSLITIAWVVLWLWEQSPYGRFLNHGELGNIGFDQPAVDLIQLGVLYVAGWTLMTMAMMLPTTVPLLEIFRRLTRQRSDRALLVTQVIAGYLLVWLGFGIAAHVFDLGLHRLFDQSAWLQNNAWVFGAGPLIVAGLFQFSRLKYRCLDKCRAPLSFVIQHWHRDNNQRQALLLGVNHGIYCVGCCWALMLLMFAVGTGNVGWMLVLGGVMAVEKNLSWGRHLSTPLGLTLIAWGGLIAVNHAWSWQV